MHPKNLELRILVVDDVDSMRSFMVSVMKTLELKSAVQAGNAVDAWKEINERKIDLVVLDWDMPEFDGLKLLERIRRSEAYCDMPVLMVTEHSDELRIIEAVKAGVTSVLIKPFSPAVLGEKIDAIFPCK